MAKDKTVYVCSRCGQESPKWVGKCPSCGEWNTFQEFVVRGAPATSAGLNGNGVAGSERMRPVPVGDIQTADLPRMDMSDSELNRMLGGGLVPGSLVLIGGEPGIGKSTLVLQTVLKLGRRRVLYVSGEESASQLKLRADRLMHRIRPDAADAASLWAETGCMVVCETSLEDIFVHVKNVAPELVVVDSIQTLTTSAVDGTPGSVGQVRACAASLLKFAKAVNVPVILIGHINKDGALAGPKLLEHIVDTVLQFEGDQHYMYRVLRSIKNRFGSTAELGIYEMRQDGLRPVNNPSELLLTEYSRNVSGSSWRRKMSF